MEMHTAIFVTDERQRYIRNYLCGKEKTLYWEKDLERIKEVVGNAARIILPTPVMKMEKCGISFAETLGYFSPKAAIFGGKFEPQMRQLMDEKSILYYDFMSMEKVAEKNAYITAEATLAEILKNSCYSIREQKFVVAGFGKCGKEIAALLKKLGGNVTILARKHQDRKQAKECGYNAVDFSYGPQEAYDAGTLINTVPAKVINRSIIGEMHKNAIIVDIASSPGGCDKEAAKEYGVKLIHALSLPAIYTTHSSAKVLADAVEWTIPLNYMLREEESWIFQIII